MEKPDPINPALRQRLEDRKRARAPWLYNRPPTQSKKDEGANLAPFWITFYVVTTLGAWLLTEVF